MEHKWIKLEDDSSFVYYSIGKYWVNDTNEGVIIAYMNPDHHKFVDENGRTLFAVTHYIDYYTPKPPIIEL